MLRFDCKERGKVVQRTVRLFDNSLENVIAVIDKMAGVPNFLSRRNPFETFLAEDVTVFEVDDVGMLLIGHMQYGYSASVHVTFWDKILRGREDLCRSMAELVIAIAGLKFLWCAVPLGPESRVILAFAKRIGFVPVFERNGVVVLHYTRRN